jgi:tetratricopeptide (TPR) repeat protein
MAGQRRAAAVQPGVRPRSSNGWKKHLAGAILRERMKPLIPAVLLMLAAPIWAASEQPAATLAQSETSPNRPAPQLIALEHQLLEKQEARDKGTLPPELYQAFVGRFRIELESLMPRIPPTPANKGLHAQLLSRLGAEDRQAANAGLAQALEANPDDPELLRAQAQISYESGDFPAAAEAAKRAWETSGHKDKAAWGLLKMSEGRVSATGSSSPILTKTASTPQPTLLDWTIPKNNDISPRAMGFIQSAIAARRQGDMSATWSNAQAAMNADPTSMAVQSFYSAVQGERTQTQETHAFIQKAVHAMSTGNGEEAVAWARKAYERSPGEDTKAILEDVQRRSAGLKGPAPDQSSTPKGGMPLLPLMAAGAGLTALGIYKVALSRGTNSSKDGLDPSPEVSPEQARRNYVNSAIVIGTPIVVAALVYGGPMAWRAIAPTATALIRGGQQSFQRVATSEAGALLPKEQAASQRLATLQKLPWTSWAQYPKEVVNGREYARIGERLYTQHAVQRMMPSSLTEGTLVEGRGISPTFVEDIIVRGATQSRIVDGVPRALHRLGPAEVVTENGGRLVISVNPHKYQ